MLFEKTATMSILACLMGIQVYAGSLVVRGATPAQYDGFFVLATTPTPQGLIVWYGDATVANGAVPKPAPPTAMYNCGDNAPVDCDNSNQAPKSLCQELANNLNSNPGQGLPVSPRSVCIQSGNDKCCTSWADDAGGMVQGDLISAMNDALNSCEPQNPSISARVHNAKLVNTCTTQCVSNRPTHCSDA